ncbi:hypothetical protein GCM10009533_03040 [Saccharopolyspora spinosporotrichia]|uniref:Uncharacterized protein n=1 Tax=Saccharopolyspora erythraea TaxID=1836 RepID=A0ABP3LVB6_SACER
MFAAFERRQVEEAGASPARSRHCHRGADSNDVTALRGGKAERALIREPGDSGRRDLRPGARTPRRVSSCAERAHPASAGRPARGAAAIPAEAAPQVAGSATGRSATPHSADSAPGHPATPHSADSAPGRPAARRERLAPSAAERGGSPAADRDRQPACSPR